MKKLNIFDEDNFVFNAVGKRFDNAGIVFDCKRPEYLKWCKEEFQKLSENQYIFMYDIGMWIIHDLTFDEAVKIFGEDNVLSFNETTITNLLMQKYEDILTENELDDSYTVDLEIQDYLSLIKIPDTFKTKEELDEWLESQKWIIESVICDVEEVI